MRIEDLVVQNQLAVRPRVPGEASVSIRVISRFHPADIGMVPKNSRSASGTGWPLTASATKKYCPFGVGSRRSRYPRFPRRSDSDRHRPRGRKAGRPGLLQGGLDDDPAIEVSGFRLEARSQEATRGPTYCCSFASIIREPISDRAIRSKSISMPFRSAFR